MTPAKPDLPSPAKWALVGFFRRLAASLMALVSTMAFAGLDRGGNVIHEDGLADVGLTGGIALFVVCFVVGFVVKAYMDATGEYTESATAMTAVLAGLFGGSLVSFMLFF